MCCQAIVYSVEYFENEVHQNAFGEFKAVILEEFLTNSKPNII